MLTEAPHILQQAFVKGATLDSDWGQVRLDTVTAGVLRLPSGRVVAADPFVDTDREPFDFTVASGDYPVVLSIVDIEDERRIAFAKIEFSTKPVARWAMATQEGQKVEELAPGYVFGFPVDSGTGCFADVEAMNALTVKFAEDDEYYERFIDALEACEDEESAARANHDLGDGLNIVLFYTGLGDGFYASYVGYDANGRIASLVADFGIFVLEEEVDDEDEEDDEEDDDFDDELVDDEDEDDLEDDFEDDFDDDEIFEDEDEEDEDEER